MYVYQGNNNAKIGEVFKETGSVHYFLFCSGFYIIISFYVHLTTRTTTTTTTMTIITIVVSTIIPLPIVSSTFNVKVEVKVY